MKYLIFSYFSTTIGSPVISKRLNRDKTVKLTLILENLTLDKEFAEVLGLYKVNQDLSALPSLIKHEKKMWYYAKFKYT